MGSDWHFCARLYLGWSDLAPLCEVSIHSHNCCTYTVVYTFFVFLILLLLEGIFLQNQFFYSIQLTFRVN